MMTMLDAIRGILDALQADVNDVASWAVLCDAMVDADPEGHANGMGYQAPATRAVRLIAAFALAAPTSAGRQRIENVNLYSGYAETGYEDPASGVIAVGDWNALMSNCAGDRVAVDDYSPERLESLLDAMGIECEWYDEWAACSDCGRLVRTVADSYVWTPSYVTGGGELLCLKCHAEAHPPEEPEPVRRIERIVFMQDSDDAAEPLRIIDEEGRDSAIAYLAQWDNGDGGDVHEEPAGGSSDNTYESADGFRLTWNNGLGYVGLERWVD